MPLYRKDQIRLLHGKVPGDHSHNFDELSARLTGFPHYCGRRGEIRLVYKVS